MISKIVLARKEILPLLIISFGLSEDGLVVLLLVLTPELL
jgi:hypothetical protein